ncbi:MAG: DUF3662 and FHA domain-containing protein [Anaerolineales bacterium]|jgi:hypothetical protein
MRELLARLEKRIEQLLEGSIERLFGGRMSLTSVASHLARAMEGGAFKDSQGKLWAPDRYALSIHPEDASGLFSSAPDLPADLGKAVLEAARSSGLTLAEDPVVRIDADPDQARGRVHVAAWHGGSALGKTQSMPSPTEEVSQALPQGAHFLIGNQRFEMDRPVINVGRHPQNHLVLDDPYVSRWHAQLRAREGRYVLFDLGAKAGVLVNERPARQHALKPGDAVTIGEVRLIYSEDAQRQSGLTQPIPPAKP